MCLSLYNQFPLIRLPGLPWWKSKQHPSSQLMISVFIKGVFFGGEGQEPAIISREFNSSFLYKQSYRSWCQASLWTISVQEPFSMQIFVLKKVCCPNPPRKGRFGAAIYKVCGGREMFRFLARGYLANSF